MGLNGILRSVSINFSMIIIQLRKARWMDELNYRERCKSCRSVLPRDHWLGIEIAHLAFKVGNVRETRRESRVWHRACIFLLFRNSDVKNNIDGAHVARSLLFECAMEGRFFCTPWATLHNVISPLYFGCCNETKTKTRPTDFARLVYCVGDIFLDVCDVTFVSIRVVKSSNESKVEGCFCTENLM